MAAKLYELLWLPVTLVALLVIYLPGLDNSPVFDDRLLTSGELFTQYGGFWPLKPRLFSYGTFVWIQEIFGAGWWKQRLVNLAVHVATVTAVWLLYRELLRSIIIPSAKESGASTAGLGWALAFSVGFFALNPVATYAVGYLIQRSILLATMFVVVALWCVALAVRRRSWALSVAAVFAYVLAVMSKEHAVMAPLAALPLYIIVARPSRRKMLLGGAIGGMLVVVVGTVLAFRYGDMLGKPFDKYSHIYLAQLSKLGDDVNDHAYLLSIVNQMYFFMKYGFQWLLPYSGWMSINLRPPFPVSLFSFPQALGMLVYPLTLASGFWLVTRYRDLRALSGFSLLSAGLLFATEFATVWVQDPFVLYRSYLWALAIPGVVMLFVAEIPPRPLAFLAVIVGSLFVWQGLNRIASLSDAKSVWEDAISKLPDDPRAVGRWFPYVNRAEIALDENRFQDAYRDFLVSSQLGDHGLGNYNIGAMLGMVGRYDQSLKFLGEAHRQGYDSFDVDYQRGVALAGLGQAVSAYEAFLAAYRKQHPQEVEGRLLAALGRSAMAAGKPQVSVGHYRAALLISPADGALELEYASALLNSQNYSTAREVLSNVIKVRPSSQAYLSRAIAGWGLKDKGAARVDVQEALRLAPDDPRVQEWQTKILLMR